MVQYIVLSWVAFQIFCMMFGSYFYDWYRKDEIEARKKRIKSRNFSSNYSSFFS